MRGFLSVSAIATASGFILASVVAGCGGETGSRRSGRHPDVIGEAGPDAAPQDPPVVTIKKPGKGKVLSDALPASLDVDVVLSDPLGKGISGLEFRFESGKASDEPVTVLELGKCGTAPCVAPTEEAQTFRLPSTLAVPWGRPTLVVEATTEDGRTGSASVQVVVDNDPPVITRLDPTPAPGSSFIGDLMVNFQADDRGGASVARMEVRLTAPGWEDDVVWRFPPAGKTDKADVVATQVDKKPFRLVTDGWDNAPVTLVVEAEDAVGNASSLTVETRFVTTPYFDLSCLRSAAGEGITDIEPIRVGERHGIAAASPKGVWRWEIVDEPDGELPTLKPVAQVTEAAATMIRVADLDADGRDDIVALEPVTAGGTVLKAYFQSDSGTFGKPMTFADSNGATTFDVGFLDGDPYPDVAAVWDVDELSVGISLTEEEEGKPVWRSLLKYGGAPRPTMVAIGRLGKPDGDRHVVVARPGSPLVSVFPVSPDEVVTGPLDAQLKLPDPDDASKPAVPATGLGAMLIAPVQRHLKTAQDGDVTVFLEGSRNEVVISEASQASPVVRIAGFSTGLQPFRIAAGKIDEDDIVDFAVVSRVSRMVTVFWGEKASEATPIGLSEGSSHVTGPEPVDVAIADVDNDEAHRPEVVVLDGGGTHMGVISWVRSGEKHGDFAGPRLVRLEEAPIAIEAGRFLRPDSGKPNLRDLAVLVRDKRGAERVDIIPSNPVRELPSAPRIQGPYSALDSPTGLIARDFDPNVMLDDLIITSNDVGPIDADEPKATMELIRFGLGVNHTDLRPNRTGFYAGDGPRLVAVADLDGGKTPGAPFQGLLDLAILARQPYWHEGKNVGSFGISIWVGRPDPGDATEWLFEPATAPSGGVDVPAVLAVDQARIPAGIAAGVLGSSKGAFDLAIAFNATNDFAVYFHKSVSAFKPPDGKHNVGIGTAPKAIAVAQMDEAGDELQDVVVLLGTEVAISRASGEIVPLAYGAKIDFGTPTFLGYDDGREGPFAPVALAVRDMNQDGLNDVIVLDRERSSVSVLVNLGQGRFSTPIERNVGTGPVGFVAEDLNADSCPDIATLDEVGRSVTILKNLLCSKAHCDFE